MCNICVFAGTVDGRKLSELLADAGAKVTVCVATEYAFELIEENENLTVHTGRLSESEMEDFLESGEFDIVIDATHPYAKEVTENIIKAAGGADVEYKRLIRPGTEFGSDAKVFDSAEEAAEFLDGTEGNILLTTGSKELHKFSKIKGFSERAFARVLPSEESLMLCEQAGLSPSHILAAQGPFSVLFNIEHLSMTDAKWLVTKDGGNRGGFGEKAAASINKGVKLIIIGRPPQVQGSEFNELFKEMCDRFGLKQKRKVTVVGIGPGSKMNMTFEAFTAIGCADCLIGAERIVGSVSDGSKPAFYEISPEKIVKAIEENPEYATVCVLMSGDSGFYSGTKKLLPMLSRYSVRVLPGISSFSYLCSLIGMSYEDARFISLHGRDANLAAAVRGNRKVFVLSGGDEGVSRLCERLEAAGLSNVTVYVGERLSYSDESVTIGKPAEFLGMEFDSLSSVLIVNDAPDLSAAYGLAGEEFLRNLGEDEVVPMTKMEVRAVALSKLGLKKDSICVDVGAGTGSVSIEMARTVTCGHVYAIECKEKALKLLEKNKKSFGTENMTIVRGFAPEALSGITGATHAFIGGSSGNAREIIKKLLEINPDIRIVATAIALETVGELTGIIDDFGFEEKEIVSMTVARSKKAGAYNLMSGQNPVYIFTMQKKAE